MKPFFSTLPRNIIASFKGWVMIWHILAVLLTLLFVASGFDWRYFLSTRGPELGSWMFPAVYIGVLMPVFLPLALVSLGSIPPRRDKRFAQALEIPNC
jgi:hypothetical protein